MRFRHAGSNIVHDRFEGEVVIINLENGYYYSLTGGAPPIWELLRDGAGAAEIAAALADGDAGRAAEVARLVDAFLVELEGEGLIARIEGEADAPTTAAARPAVPVAELAPAAFQPPVLTRYTDQRELLLLDPIHEVGDLGWPDKK